MKVFGCILLLLILLLLVPVFVVFDKNLEFSVTLKYFWFKRNILPKKKTETKEAEKPDEDREPKEKKKKKKELPATPQEIWELLQKLIPRLTPPVRRLLRRTTIAKFRLRMIVVGDNAADTAIKFGKVNAAVFSFVAVVNRIVTLKVKQIDIIPGFGADLSETSCSGEIRLVPLALLIAGVQFAIWSLVSAFPLLLSKSKDKKDHKQNGNDDTIAERRKEDSNGKETSIE